MITKQQYIEALKSPVRNPIIKMELLDWNENVIRTIEEDFVDGNIQKTFQNGTRYTATVTMNNKDNKYTPNPDGLIWFDKKIRIYTGLKVNGEDYFNSQGIYVLGDTEVISNFAERTITLNLYDKNTLLNGELNGVLQDTYITDQNVNVVNAMKDLLIKSNEVKPLISTNSGFDLPYAITTDAGKTRYDLIKKLSDAVSYSFYFDKNGYPRFEPMANPINLPTIFYFDDVTPLWRGSNRKYDRSTLFNSIKVVGSTVDGTTFSAISEDTNPSSPTNINMAFGRITNLITDDVIDSVELCQTRSDYELLKAVSYYETVSAKCVPIDIIDVGEVASVLDDGAGLTEGVRYQIQTITLPIKMLDEMTMTVWQVRPINLLPLNQ